MTFGASPARANLLRFSRDAVLVFAVVGINAAALAVSFGAHRYGDLGVFRDAGQAVLHGRSPYPPPVPASFRHQDAFVYPAPAAVAMVPLALVPLPVAGVGFLLLSYVALIVAVRLAGVTDWRFAALALASVTALQALTLGTITPLLTLLCAAAWHYRDRRVVTAAAFAAAIVLKLYLAPLLFWLVITGRRVTALIALAMVSVTTAACWALMEFHGLRGYPTLLRALAHVEGRRGFSTSALAQSLGASTTLARTTSLTIAGLVLVAAAIVVRRRDGQRPAFALAVVSCLVASPIVWLDYQLLLLVSIALLAPRPSPLWALPMASWVYEHHNGVVPVTRIVLAQLVLVTVAAAAIAYRAEAVVATADVAERPRSRLAAPVRPR